VPRDLPGRVGEALGRLTGRRWLVALSEAEGEPTLAEQAARARAARLDELGRSEPLRGLLELFPGARIVDIRPAEPHGSAAAAGEEGRT
jgi:DNA polymerase-3 subunit gamma/tau